MGTVVEQESRGEPQGPGRAVISAAESETPAERTAPSHVGICMECGAVVHPDMDYCPNAGGADVGEIAGVLHPVVWYERPKPQTDPVLPVGTLKEALPYLRRPFTKEAVKWRVLRGSQVIAYVDVRVVIERLNEVVAHLWSDAYEHLPSNLLLCRLTVDGVTRHDVGEHTNKKGIYSDALKRAAVHFGVGVSVYAIPSREMPASSEFGKPRTVKDLEGNDVDRGPYVKQEKGSLILTPDGHKGLREFYQRWLDQTGIERFGDPIDHGDVEDSAGEQVTPEAEAVSDLPDVQMPLTDEKADQLRAHCRTLYAGVKKSQMPKPAFESNLQQASVSHAELEAFATRLEGMQK